MVAVRSAAGPAVDEEAADIFADVVPVHVKPTGRDEFTAALTVRLKPDSALHPRSLLLELTDEADLLFYHSLVLGEGDFHTLKAEQRLLVDFQSFPAQLAELLRRCMEASNAAATVAGTRGGLGSAEGLGTGSASTAFRMLACLECGSGVESLLSIVESNQFRELTHLALCLRRGTDEAVKQHLAGKLRVCRTERSELAERLHASEEALDQARRQADELGTRAHVVAEERQHLERSLEAKHQRELGELRREHARALTELQSSLSEERARIEAELRRSLEEALGRASRAEESSQELQQQRQALTTSNSSSQERLDATEAQLREARQEVLTLREQFKQLELLKFKHEREIGELKVQLSSMREQLTLKEQLVTNQMSQIEQATTQRKALEDMLASLRQQSRALEEKFALSAQEIAKGNQIIQSLHASTKQAKAKLRLKSSALVQQEKAVLELEKAEEMSKHVLEEKEHELSRAKEREERLQQEMQELRKKLAEAHEVLKSDQDVIEYLNRQLTERDLRALPPLSKPSEGPPELRGSPLAELLRRAENAGRALGGGSAGSSAGSAGARGTSGLGGLTAELRAFDALGGVGAAPAPLAGPPSCTPGPASCGADPATAAAVAGLGALGGPVAYRTPQAAELLAAAR